MKKLLGIALLGAVGYYLWKNHFARLFQPKDQVKEVLEEVRLKNEIGNDKRAVFLAHQVPTSTIGDTPYAGVPLTAMCSPQLMEAKGLTLLPKGGTSRPNPFDRVIAWLNVIALLLTVQVAGAAVPLFPPAKTIWVSGGGVGVLSNAKSQARAGMTIVVGPGEYTDHNLWKPGVNWYGMPGANLSWTDAGDSIGLWDDRVPGPGTNTIVWQGRLKYFIGEPLSVLASGAFVITNGNSWLMADINYLEIKLEDGGVGSKGGAFCIRNCRKAVINVFDIFDSASGTSYASALYWEKGLVHFTFGRAVMDNGYGIWCQEPEDAPATDLYVNGQFVSVLLGIGNPTCVRFTATNDNYRTWINILEAKNFSTASYAIGLDGPGGKLYYKGQKVGSATSAFQIAGGTFWCELDKVSASSGNWVTATGGRSFWSVRHWEDHTTNLSAGWSLRGGRHDFGPGTAEILNGKGIEHLGGTNRFTGLTIDCRGTNTITSVTNNRPVTIGNGTSNLTLDACVLLSPIATANGGAFSIFCTNVAVAHCIFTGTTVCNSNTAGVIPIVASLLTTNQPQLR